MGADSFRQEAKGDTAKAAFQDARDEAAHEFGHRGYTGSIAEKTSFVMIDVPDGIEPDVFANNLMDADDPRISDKWGPAGCIDLKDGSYLFFGWASC